MIGMVTAAAAVAAARGTTGCGSDAFERQRLAGTGGKGRQCGSVCGGSHRCGRRSLEFGDFQALTSSLGRFVVVILFGFLLVLLVVVVVIGAVIIVVIIGHHAIVIGIIIFFFIIDKVVVIVIIVNDKVVVLILVGRNKSLIVVVLIIFPFKLFLLIVIVILFIVVVVVVVHLNSLSLGTWLQRRRRGRRRGFVARGRIKNAMGFLGQVQPFGDAIVILNPITI